MLLLWQKYCPTLIKKEKKIFLIYKEIQMGSGAKSYIRKCENFPPYVRMPLVIYDFAPYPP
jgi:hypothetical protein